MEATLRTSLCLVIFLAVGCTPKPAQKPNLTLKTGMNLQDADKALERHRAVDWTVGCSYLAIGQNVELRHYWLPNDILVSLLAAADPESAAPTPRKRVDFYHFTVYEITVANSRMLRADKAETSYSVAALEQGTGLQTTLSGIETKHDRAAFVYKSMLGRNALAVIAGAGKAATPLKEQEIATWLEVLNREQQLRWAFPSARDELGRNGKWYRYSLSAETELLVKLEPPADSGEDLVARLVCRYAPAGEKEIVFELELVDVLDPIPDLQKLKWFRARSK